MFNSATAAALAAASAVQAAVAGGPSTDAGGSVSAAGDSPSVSLTPTKNELIMFSYLKTKALAMSTSMLRMIFQRLVATWTCVLLYSQGTVLFGTGFGSKTVLGSIFEAPVPSCPCP
jgi:hypothetical protein